MRQPSVVVIGFSAGGLVPLKTFFEHTPLDNTAYIVLSHLLPGYNSELSDILSKHAILNVVPATDGAILAANTVYVLTQAARILIASDRRLELHPLKQQHAAEVIDIFLMSLAASGFRHMIVILLSGAGNDGSRGIAAIKSAGGIVIVQTPASCEFDGMPKHAVASGHVDFVLPVAQIPAYLKAWEESAGGLDPINIDAMNLLLTIGKNIRRLRTERSMRQEALAVLCGMQKASLSRIEAGKTNATVDSLQRIADALNVEIKQFFLTVE